LLYGNALRPRANIRYDELVEFELLREVFQSRGDLFGKTDNCLAAQLLGSRRYECMQKVIRMALHME
jgi:hypothetical protein